MMRILDLEKYQQYLSLREEGAPARTSTFWLILLVFGSMGAITWAIRGTSGWGGVDGTVVPGMMWALLWYYYCTRAGIDSRGVIFWLGFGIALGGELGYGQYTAWILGKFYVGDKIIPIDPWVGYLWFMICGIGWAAPGGILLGWALGKRMSTAQWIYRSVLLAVLLLFLFAWPFVDWLAARMVELWPGLIFPNASLGIYSGELGKHLERAVYTNTQNFAVLVWWMGALIIAAFQKDKTTLVTGLLLGLGFGLGFMQSGTWCLGYDLAPGYIDWWKIWELNAGFNLGILYALTLFWAIKQVDKQNGKSESASRDSFLAVSHSERYETIFLAIAGAVFIYFMGFEYFFWPGLVLSLIFLLSLVITIIPIKGSPQDELTQEKRSNLLLLFTVFILVFLMIHGGSERAGFILGLYPMEAVDQYAWPFERILLATPFMLILAVIVLSRIWEILFNDKDKGKKELNISRLSIWMVDLMAGLGFIGALSIWPAKIGVLYALFLLLALSAFTRINNKLSLVVHGESK